MSPLTPEWTAFNPAEPPSLPPDDEDLGRVVVLAATSEAVERGWAAEVALGMVREWARRGEQVLMVDAHLEAPVIHELVGIPNNEGHADA